MTTDIALPLYGIILQAFKLLVEDKQQVDGLENSTLSVAAQKAKDAGQKNATMEKGPWLLTVDFSTYSAVMSFAKDRELRKKIYKAYRGLASRGKVDNGPIILEILALRKEMAQMLGYPNYAEDSFSSKVRCIVQTHCSQRAAAAKPTEYWQQNMDSPAACRACDCCLTAHVTGTESVCNMQIAAERH